MLPFLCASFGDLETIGNCRMMESSSRIILCAASGPSFYIKKRQPFDCLFPGFRQYPVYVLAIRNQSTNDSCLRTSSGDWATGKSHAIHCTGYLQRIRFPGLYAGAIAAQGQRIRSCGGPGRYAATVVVQPHRNADTANFGNRAATDCCGSAKTKGGGCGYDSCIRCLDHRECTQKHRKT